MRLLGIDVGTTAVKAAIFDIDGNLVCSWRRDYPTTRSGNGVVEQNPQDWLDGISDAIVALGRGCDLSSVRAVGICSQVNTHVFVAENGDAIGQAIVWQDTRAAEAAAALDATITAAEKLSWWGSSVSIDPSHLLARMIWLQRNHPDRWVKTRYVLSPKDFCIFRLTGSVSADAIASVGLVDSSLRYIEPLIDRVSGARARLPTLANFDRVVGSMRLAGTHADVPVVNGTMDAWSSLFGSGAFAAGKGMYMSGTSEILAVVGVEQRGAPGVVTFPRVDDLVVSAGPTQSGGDSVRWWSHVSGKSTADIFDSAALASRSDAPILFLPHLEGERAPLWNPQLRAAFIGLSAHSGAPEMALAVLEGVALSARLLLHSLREASGVNPTRLIYGGGGSKSDLWSQIRADCLGVSLQRLAVPDAGCLGAAIVAAVGVGQFLRVADASDSMAKVDRVFEPDPRFEDRYDRMYDEFIDTVGYLGKARRLAAERTSAARRPS